jgi:hypothetical protein
MAKLPENPKDIEHLIWKAYEAKQEGNRSYLGMSQIGEECARKLWYGFRHVAEKKFEGRILSLFERGHNEESHINSKLRMIGIKVVEHDENGKQFEFVGYKGHLKGHMDAALLYVPESIQTWHVGEHKTHSDKSWQAVKKNGVKKSKPVHWAQIQMYMGHSGMRRALYVAVNKNDDSIYSERVHFDPKPFDDLSAKAAYIIDAQVPPERLSTDPAWYECKRCDFQEICHRKKIPLVNCRTCARSTPIDGGLWACEKHGMATGVCGDHLFNPALIGTPADGRDDYVMYSGFINATESAAEGNDFDGHLVHTSKQLEQCGFPAIAADPVFSALREEFA